MTKNLITGMLLAAALSACDQPLSPGVSDSILSGGPDLSVASAPGEAVRLPFQGTAFTTLESLAPDPSCGAPPRFRNIQVGEGEATHLGRFTVRFVFCVDATDLLDDGRLTEGESIPYDNGVGVIVAANGDELHLTTEGTVLPSQDPDFDFEFHDPLHFDGGTGRFAGAGGMGMTDSYVTQEPERTEHSWSGTLVLRPER